MTNPDLSPSISLALLCLCVSLSLCLLLAQCLVLKSYINLNIFSMTSVLLRSTHTNSPPVKLVQLVLPTEHELKYRSNVTQATRAPQPVSVWVHFCPLNIGFPAVHGEIVCLELYVCLFSMQKSQFTMLDAIIAVKRLHTDPFLPVFVCGITCQDCVCYSTVDLSC